MRNLTGLAPMVPSLVMVLLAGLGIRQAVRRMKSLQGEQLTLTRDTMVSAFAAAMTVSLAGVAYFFWSSGGNSLLLASAVLCFVAFVASVIWVGRLSFQWGELMLRRKKRPA